LGLARPEESALVRDAVVYPAKTLLAVCAHLTVSEPIASLVPRQHNGVIDNAALPDLAEVRGPAHAKRALTIAAAGAHSLLTV
jgi:magnesium chelatase family protein